MNTISLKYLRSIFNLLPSQVIWRILVRLRNRLPPDPGRWSFSSSEEPSLRTDFPAFVPLTRYQEPTAQLVERLSKGMFEYLNRSYSLGRVRPDWRLGPIEKDRLWTITLHYHEWAYDLVRIAAGNGPEASAAAGLFQHYVDDWITRCALNEPGARVLAWNPYAIATRIGWWLRSWIYRPGSGKGESDVPPFSKGGLGGIWSSDFRKRFLRSLWQQASYLRGHLERDLRANHFLRDAVGLAWAGRFFDEPDAREWLRTAEQIAVEQAREQVLPDCGHFERTPMYHIHVMGDFLVLAHLLETRAAREAMREAWERMAECLAWMRHPDGQIPLLNDSALNSACTPQEMLDQGRAIDCEVQSDPRQGGRLFPDFGVFAWHGDTWTVFFDVGPVGVRYQLGHAHADTLTIEASYLGQRLLVDPGTYAYDFDARREHDRSTASHNTVCVDGQNSSEVWHIFRCGRTASVRNVQVHTNGGGFRAMAEHTGYRHLPGRPIVQREVVEDSATCLIVTDLCEGSGVHRLTGGWLLDPQWEAQDADGGWRVFTPDGKAVRVSVQGPVGMSLHTRSCPYHPEFGLERMTTRLEWAIEGPLPIEIRTVFSPE